MSKHGKQGLLALACFAFFAFTSFSVYAACSSPSGTKGQIVYNAAQNVLQYCNNTNWLAMGPLNPGASGTACSNPTGTEGKIVFNGTESVMQFCNGANWIAMGPVPGAGGAGCSNPTSAKGAMVYNDTQSVMQYCNGAAWVAIGKYASGGGGGGGIDPDSGSVLESFDQDPFTGNPLFDDWGEFGGAPLGWEKSTSHVEQGSYSWHFSENAPGALGGNAPAGYLDLSGYTSMTLQVHIDTMGANDQVGLYINDGTYSLNDKTPNGATGDFVLEIIFADQPLLNLGNINVTITTDTNEGDPKDFYIDNLRIQP